MTKLSPNVKLVIFSNLDAKTVFLKMSLISKIDRKKIKEYFLLDHLRKGSKRIDICYNWFLDEDKESIWSEYQYCIFKEICFSLNGIVKLPKSLWFFEEIRKFSEWLNLKVCFDIRAKLFEENQNKLLRMLDCFESKKDGIILKLNMGILAPDSLP